MNLFLLQAAPAGQAGGNMWMSILMMVALFLVFWLFFIRPQQKRQKDLQKKREAMKVGDRVITSGGIYGVIKDIKASEFVIEIADGVRVRIDKGSVFMTAEESAENVRK
ncbi:preprotein translocase subunit YajC [Porphyromonas macacae]|nr:preprotein translocase subunit YajC [Porphyromonas macacae]KGN72305.1 preprotein translocase subunit YajC [Porphyromonas macacae]KGN98557.1 preprotein translocase subunit YajC [Porphyromonas macacae]